MSKFIGKSISPRYSLPYNSVPTQKGSVWGGSFEVYIPSSDYGCVLDSVYEMTDMVASGNGCSFQKALNRVLEDEGYILLPSSKKMILKELAKV